MQVCKIVHRKQDRIKVDFPYNKDISTRLMQIPDAKWSKTHRAWHIPYTKAAFSQLKMLFPAIEYSTQDTRLNSEVPTGLAPPLPLQRPLVENFHPAGDVTIHVYGRKIAIKLPKNDLDTRFILGMRFSRWDVHQYCWVVPHYKDNLELLKAYFKDRIVTFEIHEDFVTKTSSSAERKIGNSDLLIIKTRQQRLRLIFANNKAVIKVIKNIPFCMWNSENKWWSIPFAEKYLQELNVVAIDQKMNVIYEEEYVDVLKKPRLTANDILNYRKTPDDYLFKLKELRYSEHTIRNYCGMFEEFINFYHKVEITKIDESMIIGFMRYLVIERKVSTAYQNQSINAIKFYYERVLGGHRKVYLVDRPMEEKKLPVVLSEEEMEALLNVTDNLKHKAILMLAYSAGLRLGEIIHARLKDIDSKRMQIRIEQGKGKKDRYSLLSVKMLEVLRAYFLKYKPTEWLFEGSEGGLYSARSIHAIVKDSGRKAGIKKNISAHTLRHTFATHLLENGTDIRYIQILLGHESSKTTELYTHVTTKGFSQIKSPLDKLNNL